MRLMAMINMKFIMPPSAMNSVPNSLAAPKPRNEDIVCRPIKPVYDGTPEALVPFLNRLDIRRQDEDWSSITLITQHETQHDLIRHFTKINEETMISLAQRRWYSPTLNQDKYTFGHDTYKVRCFAHLLFGSITDDLSTLILGRVDQDFRNDGPLLLWVICNNIHRNNIAFIETINLKYESQP